MNKRVYEIAEKFEQCCKSRKIEEERLESALNDIIVFSAQDIYYLLSILLSPEMIQATKAQKPEDMVWGDSEARWPLKKE